MNDHFDDPSAKAGLVLHHMHSSVDQLIAMIAMGGIDAQAVRMEHPELRRLAARLEVIASYVKQKEGTS